MTDLEALAVVWAVKTFRLYVMGTCFKVVTYHNVLKALVHKATLEIGKLRWRIYYKFGFGVIYHCGKEIMLPTH